MNTNISIIAPSIVLLLNLELKEFIYKLSNFQFQPNDYRWRYY